MPAWTKKEVDSLKANVRRKFGDQISSQKSGSAATANYLEFKSTFMPKHLTIYESFCNQAAKILPIAPDAKRRAELNQFISVCHLNVTPEGATSLSLIAPVLLIILGSVFSYFIFPNNYLAFIIVFMILALIIMSAIAKLPEFFANTWRLKSSNQMVQCIFYIVTFMRHTSNLELAINFASEHVPAPLSLDLKKVLWDVETEKFGTIKESLDTYLEGWRKYNIEFIESFHLIESSLYETSEERRLALIDRSLSTMLEETYEKMLHFSHELKGPINLLYMFGVILPILGLVILPIVANFMSDKGLHPVVLAALIGCLYNLILPIVIFYRGRLILSSRPTGYGDTDISEANPELKKFKSLYFKVPGGELTLSPIILSLIIFAISLVIGLFPIWFHYINPNYAETDLSGDLALNLKLLDYRTGIKDPSVTIGPYGLIATLLSVALIFGIGISIGLYYKVKSGYLIKLRENSKRLEQEFSSALFQLGNRLGDGVPAEIAFGRVAEVMRGTTSGEFFEVVSLNITKLGMGVERAIFDTKIGAIIYFPSNVIDSSMKVLIESSRKGPNIASQALINVSQYIKDIHKVNERVRDLLSDLLTDMKQQVSVLAPAIASIVVGVTSMIALILIKLAEQLANLGSNVADNGAAGSQITKIFGDPIPTYFFQIVVGLYIIQVTYILTIMTNGIENGSDNLGEYDALGNNMIKGTTLYCTITIIVVVLFNILASVILQSIATT